MYTPAPSVRELAKPTAGVHDTTVPPTPPSVSARAALRVPVVMRATPLGLMLNREPVMPLTGPIDTVALLMVMGKVKPDVMFKPAERLTLPVPVLSEHPLLAVNKLPALITRPRLVLLIEL